MEYQSDNIHEINYIVDSDTHLYMCFSMSELHKDMIFNHCRHFMSLLLRKYRPIIDQMPIRYIDPMCGANPERTLYRLSIQMNINETLEDKPRIYFYFEVYNYGEEIDCSEKYINTHEDEDAQVYVKEMIEILNGTRQHIVYDESDDESDYLDD